MVALRAITSRLSDSEQEYLLRLVQLLAVPRWRPPPPPPSDMFPSPEYVAKRAAQEKALRAAAQVVARPPLDSDVGSVVSSSMRTAQTEGGSGANESRGPRTSPTKQTQRTSPNSSTTADASGSNAAGAEPGAQMPTGSSFQVDDLMFGESAVKLDFKLFSIVAALSQRVATLEYEYFRLCAVSSRVHLTFFKKVSSDNNLSKYLYK